jgi:molybdopterin synthase catalytic subunit
MTVKVQLEDFDLSTEVAVLRRANPKVGAVACFIGAVRDLNEGENVSAMVLEHYPGMTEKALEAIIERARERWPIADAVVIHRYGPLAPTDQIVLVAVATAHRGDAFAACEFIMDYLKTAAPFWKKETLENGERWVDAREHDHAALDKWAEPGPPKAD